MEMELRGFLSKNEVRGGGGGDSGAMPPEANGIYAFTVKFYVKNDPLFNVLSIFYTP